MQISMNRDLLMCQELARRTIMSPGYVLMSCQCAARHLLFAGARSLGANGSMLALEEMPTLKGVCFCIALRSSFPRLLLLNTISVWLRDMMSFLSLTLNGSISVFNFQLVATAGYSLTKSFLAGEPHDQLHGEVISCLTCLELN